MRANMSRRMPVLVAGMLLASAALAQEAKEGRVDMTTCFGGPVHTNSPTAQDRFGTYEVTGGVTAVAGPAPSGSIECGGYFEMRGKAYQHRGYCLLQDAAGHKIFIADTRNAQGYTWEYTGGTGKFEGISGSGTSEVMGSMTPVRVGTMQGCRRLVGSYKLP